MTQPASPIDHLFTLLEVAKQAGPPHVVAWLEAGLDGYLAAGGTLDEHLGLKPENGKRTWRTRFLQLRRDGYLKKAHALCEGSPWRRSCTLEAEVRRFESVLWPRLREDEKLPERLSDLRRFLFLAFKIGLPVPTSARQLHDLCTM